LEPELTVGVLGGLGPAATLDFLAKVLALTDARSDQEHLHLIIDNDPKVPNRNEALAGRGPSSGPALAAMARRLEAAGADFLVMPCNTAHAFAPDIRAATPIPLLSMIEETCAALVGRFPGVREVGVLAAFGCRQARLYETALAARGVAALSLDEARQTRFMELVYAIKAGDRGPRIKAGMVEFGETLIAMGAEAVVAACSEVPLVLGGGDLSRPLLDSTAVLAEATVACARRRKPLPVASAHRAAG
jgi:aspartate racemase